MIYHTVGFIQGIVYKWLNNILKESRLKKSDDSLIKMACIRPYTCMLKQYSKPFINNTLYKPDSVVDHGYQPQSDQTKDWLVQNLGDVSGWSNMNITNTIFKWKDIRQRIITTVKPVKYKHPWIHHVSNSYISKTLAHWNTSTLLDMLLHPDTSPRFWTNQSLVWSDWGWYPWSTTLSVLLLFLFIINHFASL
jgi:hypothetical protein